jgi:integrase
MNKQRGYISVYATLFDKFILIKRGLGYVANETERILIQFDKYFFEENETNSGITKEQIEKWRSTLINDAPATIYHKHVILGQFCRFLRDMGYDCYIPKLPNYPGKYYFIPYIFSDEEMKRVFDACDNLHPFDKNKRTALFIIPSLIRLLYGTGIRIGEALSLKNKDIDFDHLCIYIRKSKNGEERLVPLSETLTEVLKQYVHYRNHVPIADISNREKPFFVSPRGTAFERKCVYDRFRSILKKAGVPYFGGHKGPRLHDLRHTFAVHSLAMMAKSGLDLYYSLPLLSTFLGHKTLDATEQYVRLTSEMYSNILKDENGVCAHIFPNPLKNIDNGND